MIFYQKDNLYLVIYIWSRRLLFYLNHNLYFVIKSKHAFKNIINLSYSFISKINQSKSKNIKKEIYLKYLKSNLNRSLNWYFNKMLIMPLENFRHTKQSKKALHECFAQISIPHEMIWQIICKICFNYDDMFRWPELYIN